MKIEKEEKARDGYRRIEQDVVGSRGWLAGWKGKCQSLAVCSARSDLRRVGRMLLRPILLLLWRLQLVSL